jgi:preprotein translocase subunit SecY
MSAPKDLRVSEILRDAKTLETEVPGVSANIDSAMQYWAQLIEEALPGTDFAVKVKQIATQAKGAASEVTKDVAAAQQLEKGLAIPLALAGGITVKGSGQLVASAEGLQSSMTKWQKIVSEAASVFYLIASMITTAGTLLLLIYPPAATWTLGSGVTLGLLTGALRSKLIPALAQYSDAAPRAVLVQSPLK